MTLFNLRKIALCGILGLVAVPGALLVQEKASAAPQLEIAQAPPIGVRKTPDAFVAPVNGSVNIILVNTSPSVISYMIPGQTQFTDIEPNEEVTVSTMDLPSYIGIRQLDGGLSYAEVASISRRNGSVTVELSHLDPDTFAENPDVITRSIVVSSTGGVYID